MSRRYASHQPAAAMSDETVYAAHFGAQTRQPHRRMPGCRERCCSLRFPAAVRVAQARLDWQMSGADLVPPLARLVAVLAVLGCAWRGMGAGA